MKRFITPIIGTLLSATLTMASAAGKNPYPLPSPAVPGSLGVNIHFTDPAPGEMDQIAKGGFRWVRMDFAWDGIEREKGQYDFSAYDRLLKALEPHRIRAIFILDYGNDLYQEGSPRSPEAVAAFARWAAASVKHFKGHGILWEMYNEPNIGFWKPAPNVDEYIALAKATGKALKTAEPSEYYIGPATSGMDFDFMEKCFQAGLLEYWDAVSFHPYRNDAPETAAPDFRHVRDLIARYAPKGKAVPILSCEWGYSELYPGLNLEKQAKFISREYLSNMANGLLLSIWYDWHDDGRDPKEIEHHFGTVYNDYKPKPTYLAAQTLARSLDGFRYNKRLALESKNDYCLLFSKGNEARLAVWTTEPTPHEVTLPAASGRFRVVGSAGQTSEATASDAGLRLTLTDAPQYLLPLDNHGSNRLLSLAAQWAVLPPSLLVKDEADLETALDRLLIGSWPSTEEGNPTIARLTVNGLRAVDRSVDFTLNQNQKPTPTFHPLPVFRQRDEGGSALRATLSLPGQPGSIAQVTEVYSAAPLQIVPMSPGGGVLPVRIENPSGEPFTGQLRSTLGKGSVQSLQLNRGEKEAVVKMPVPAATGDGLKGRFVLEEKTDGKAFAVLETPTLSFQPLPNPPCPAVSDGDPKVSSTLKCDEISPPAGLPVKADTATQIRYAFGVGWKFLRLPAPEPLQKPLEDYSFTPYALGMWVYGDGSGDLLRMRFADATGQTFQPDGGRVDFKGWRYVSFPLTEGGFGHWGGADDGKIHAPIHFDTLFLVDSPGGRGGKGSLEVTGLTLVSREALETRG